MSRGNLFVVAENANKFKYRVQMQITQKKTASQVFIVIFVSFIQFAFYFDTIVVWPPN